MVDNSFDDYNEENFSEPNIGKDLFIEKENNITEYERNFDVNQFCNNGNNDYDNESEISPSIIFLLNQSTNQKTKIFDIEKKNKKGRRKKVDNNRKEIKHGKTASDIIKQKIKTRFVKSTMNYLNDLYKKYPSNNKRKAKIFLRKIKTDFTKNLKKNRILEYFSKTLRQFYSSNLGGHFKRVNKDYNKHNIEILIQKNKAKDIIELLNKTLEDVYKIYINDEISEFSLMNDLKEIEEQYGTAYMKRYKEIALKLIINYKKKGKKDSLNSAEDNEIILNR